MTILDSAIKDLYEARQEIERLRVELEKNSKELEVYKKATTFISEYVECNYSCDLCRFQKECKDDMTSTSCSEFIRTMFCRRRGKNDGR